MQVPVTTLYTNPININVHQHEILTLEALDDLSCLSHWKFSKLCSQKYLYNIYCTYTMFNDTCGVLAKSWEKKNTNSSRS